MRRASRSRSLAAIGVGIIAGMLVGCRTAGPPPQTAPATTSGPQATPDLGDVALGRQVYLQNCAACHGPNAQGAPNWAAPDARGNLPPPPHDDSGHTWRHGDAELANIIRNGQRDIFNKTPELTMPPFKDRLTDEQIAAVIAYFKSLWSAEHRRYQEEQSLRPAMSMATPEVGQQTTDSSELGREDRGIED